MIRRGEEGGFEIAFNFKGMSAIVVLVLLAVAFFLAGYLQFKQAGKAIDEARDRIRLEIVSEYARKNLPQADMINQTGASDKEVKAAIDTLVRETRINLESFGMRGGLMPGQVVFRVEYTVDRKAPPDGERVRFYSMPYSWIVGWDEMPYRTHPVFWSLALYGRGHSPSVE